MTSVRVCIHSLFFNSLTNTENPSVNYESVIKTANKLMNVDQNNNNFKFIRKGTVGSYKEDMNQELEDKFDEWINCKLKLSDFEFHDATKTIESNIINFIKLI